MGFLNEMRLFIAGLFTYYRPAFSSPNTAQGYADFCIDVIL